MKKHTVFTVTVCFSPGLRGRQKDCSPSLILRTPMCTRLRQTPKSANGSVANQLNTLSWFNPEIERVSEIAIPVFVEGVA